MSATHRRIGSSGLRDAAVALAATVVAALVLAVAWPVAAPALAQQDGSESLDVTVSVEPAATSVVLGDSLDLVITVTNGGGGATPPLVLHLDILDPDSDASVDPEDWTSTLTRPLDEIPPGGSTEVPWTVQPISAGTFSAYAVVVRPSGTGLAASNITEVMVDDQRSLNPGNILPLSIGAPLIVGGALVAQWLAARRSDDRDRRPAAERPVGAST